MELSGLYRQPGHLIRRAHQIASAAFVMEAQRQNLDLTAVQFSALVAIRDNPGTDATRVSEYISFDRTTIGHVLARLEKKGLITRTPGIEDKRTKRLRITSEGQEVIQAITGVVPAIAERILGRLSDDERRTLLVLLARLADVGPYRSGGDFEIGERASDASPAGARRTG